jgi:hypothetical protein
LEPIAITSLSACTLRSGLSSIRKILAADGAATGSCHVPGGLKSSPQSRSAAAINAWDAKRGVEFVFDPGTGRLAMGRLASELGLKGSPHQQLAQVIDANPNTVVVV